MPAIAGCGRGICLKSPSECKTLLGAYFCPMNYGAYENDTDALKARGWTYDSIREQEAQLRSGCQPVAAIAACKTDHGIFVLDSEARSLAQEAHRQSLDRGARWVRFIPASGAASRMFAGMREPRDSDVDSALQKSAQDFPFWSQEQKRQLASLPASQRPTQAAHWMLDARVGWSRLPKGLIPFHQQSDGVSFNSFKEHAKEWSSLMGDSAMHFTVPGDFQEAIAAVLAATGHPNVETSIQHQATDTVALSLDTNELVRHASGGLLFRPGGHGALLQNLDAVQGDFVCIRNIDNVVQDSRMANRNAEQEILMGECVRLTEERNRLIFALQTNGADALEEVVQWLINFDEKAYDHATDVNSCLHALDRPIRVAGMVKNTGEPGGGPFWVKQSNGSISPGIAESSELPEDMKGKGTHFNPVDIICSVKRADGEGAYALNDFADRDMFFTARKMWQGKSIRILERPGLWNGAMAHWLTRFVEVPNSTFAPVKTVLDLLKPERQA